MSAAFDTVNHAILLEVLENKFGITDDALEWFQSYLCPQFMTVHVVLKYSSLATLPFLAAQGSCPGSILFNLYSSTIGDHIPNNILFNGSPDHHTLQIDFTPTINELYVIKTLEKSLEDSE